jgi:DNA (cytosine-5)-methyltransferase 1
VRYISVFSGIEAASVAWRPLGWEAVALSEIDPFPSAVLAARYPDVPNLGDVTQVEWSAYRGAADIVVGGSPCQSFSVAGKREGLAGASGLMWEYARAVREIMPRVFIWENVPGALSSSHGEDFGCLLRSMDDLGYGLAWRVLDAQFFGVAQRRRRLFLVGFLGDAGRAAEILFEQESLCRDHPTSREKRQELARAAGAGAVSDSRCLTPRDLQSLPQYGPEVAGTLTARFGSSPRADSGQSVVCMASGQAHAETCDDMCPTLMARQYKDPPIAAYALRMRSGKAGGGKGPLVQTDVSETLATGNDRTIICHAPDGTTNVLYAGRRWQVRRLTPMECERLQGFPDDWTRIAWRGKPPEECPDAPRYKATGNSMAVPVMRWIGERIMSTMHEEDER